MRINENIKIRDIAGERVAVRQGNVDVDMTKIIAFNPTAEWLWNELSGKDFTESDIVDLLIEGFELDETTAKTDAKRWMDQCIKARIVDI